uniref:DUF2752 domain-containing protein n=1 Tax=Eiseniibacteriota bacterium TaxID=2212470 RepID=A0A832MIZ7_UNCEI
MSGRAACPSPAVAHERAPRRGARARSDAAAARRGALVWLGAGVAALAAGAALVAWAGAQAGGEPACALRAASGIACPTCGGTRALAALGRGDLSAAWRLHPWSLLAPAQVFAAWAAWGLWRAGRLPARPDRWAPHAALVNAVALTAWWLASLLGGAASSAR